MPLGISAPHLGSLGGGASSSAGGGSGSGGSGFLNSLQSKVAHSSTLGNRLNIGGAPGSAENKNIGEVLIHAKGVLNSFVFSHNKVLKHDTDSMISSGPDN